MTWSHQPEIIEVTLDESITGKYVDTGVYYVLAVINFDWTWISAHGIPCTDTGVRIQKLPETPAATHCMVNGSLIGARSEEIGVKMVNAGLK